MLSELIMPKTVNSSHEEWTNPESQGQILTLWGTKNEHLSKHHRMSSQAPNALKINVVTYMEMKRCRNKLKSDQMADKWAFYESQF